MQVKTKFPEQSSRNSSLFIESRQRGCMGHDCTLCNNYKVELHSLHSTASCDRYELFLLVCSLIKRYCGMQAMQMNFVITRQKSTVPHLWSQGVLQRKMFSGHFCWSQSYC